MDTNDQPTGQTYEIRTVADFMALTPRQREHAAKDFLLFVRYVNSAQFAAGQTNKAFDLEPGTVTVRTPDSFTWIDDGDHTADVRFSGPGGESMGAFTRNHADEMRDL